jgi:protein-S-isoprenylcysteine O-methyltransferase Ste14
MAGAQKNQDSTISAGNVPAAVVTGQIVMAHMTFYVVDETKLESLSAQNDETRAFSAVASAFASLAVGLFLQQFFTDHLSDKAWIIVWFVAPTCLLVSLIFAALAVSRYCRGKSILTAIKANAATPTVPLKFDVK